MITLVRADERLIHGQTMLFVVRDYNIDRIIVVDNLTATTPLLKSIFQAAAPKEIITSVHTSTESIEIINEALNNDEKTLLLMKHPRTFVELRALIEGLPNELNIGAQMAKNGKKYAEYASLSEEDIEACYELAEDNVRVYFNAQGSATASVEFTK